MKSFKIFFSLMIILASIGGVNSSFASENNSDNQILVKAQNNQETLNSAIKFREMYGLSTSHDIVPQIIKEEYLSSDLELELGFPLLEEEKSILSERNSQLEDSTRIRDLVKNKYSDVFAGSIFNSKNGETTILLTDKNFISEIARINTNSKLNFEVVDFSLNQLMDVNDVLSQNASILKELNINLYSVNEKANRVVIYSGFEEDVNTEKLHELIDIKYVTFEKANFKLLNNFNLELGEYVQGWNRRDVPYRLTSNCSSGFYAVNNLNQAVLVTAGHCNKVNSSFSWYKGSYSQGNIVGNFHRKVTGTYQNSDASSIVLSNSVNITPKIGYFNLTSVNNTTETSGQTIYYKGYSTGANYGEYSGGVCIPPSTHGDTDMGTLCDLAIVDNMSPSGGDSGGVVFTTPSGARLHGILTGGMDTNNDGIYDKMVFSRIGYIYSDLNLSSIIVY